MGDWGWHSACHITLPCNLLSTISFFYRSLSCLLRSFLLIYTGFQEVLEERNKASLNCLFSLLQMVWYLATRFKHLLLLKLYRLSTRNSLLHSANIVSSFSVNVNTVEFSILVPKLSITSCSTYNKLYHRIVLVRIFIYLNWVLEKWFFHIFQTLGIKFEYACTD